MKLTFAEIRDTVDGAIDYLHRIVGGGSAAALKDAIPWGLPGYFYRPDDANENTVGTEDCLLVEQGDHRHVISTRNATAWQRLLSYLARALDRGERIITAENGTARAYLSLRPDGTMKAMSDDGGGNTCEATLDPAGNIDLVVTGKTRIGGAAATSAICRTVELLADFNTALTGKVALYNTHTHLDPVAGSTGPPQAPFIWGNIPATIESATGETD